jgi:hypothetical protein
MDSHCDLGSPSQVYRLRQEAGNVTHRALNEKIYQTSHAGSVGQFFA